MNRILAAQRTFEAAYLPMMAVKTTLEKVLEEVKAIQPQNIRQGAALRTLRLNLLSAINKLDALEYVDFLDMILLIQEAHVPD